MAVWLLVVSASLLGLGDACTSTLQNTPLASPGVQNILDRLGKTVSIKDYDGSSYNQQGGGPVNRGSDLSCSFEKGCCWRNADPPQDEFQWAHASGTPEKALVKEYLNTEDGPTGDYLVAASLRRVSPEDEADFVSCTVACAQSSVKVSLRHWTSDTIRLRVCRQKSFSSQESLALTDCQDVPRQNTPGPTTVTLPAGELFEVVVVATGFTSELGGIAIIDDLQVDYEPCADVTTPKPLGNSDAYDCERVYCNLNSNKPCRLGDAPGTSAKFQKAWSGPLGNRDSGVPGGVTGNRYTGAALGPNDQAAITTEDLQMNEDRVLKFKYYEASDGTQFKVCLNDLSTCPFASNKDVTSADRKWRQGAVTVPARTKKILFSGQSQGPYYGAVGLDDVQLYRPDPSGSPDAASVPVC